MVIVPYVLVQLIAYVVEMACFSLAFSSIGFDVVIANLISKIFAGFFAFIAHRKFTFSEAENSNLVFQAIKYFILLSLNIPASSIFISLFVLLIPNPFIAKFLSDLICVAVTFFVSKKIIFTSSNSRK
jgi:putative flippase GtrA